VKKAWLRVRLRVCDDSAGPLSAHVEQRRGVAGRTVARRTFRRTLPTTAGGCRSYRFSWRLGEKFRGSGLLVVELRLRDAGGAWSRTVGPVSIGGP
jgi:hypothetical protein